MHGEQEAKLVLEDGFSYDHVQEESVEQTMRMEVEEPCQNLGSLTRKHASFTDFLKLFSWFLHLPMPVFSG